MFCSPGHIVKVNPRTVGAGDDAFGTEYDTILLPFIQPGQRTGYLFLGVLPRRFCTPAFKDFICIMVMAAGTAVVVVVMMVVDMAVGFMVVIMFFVLVVIVLFVFMIVVMVMVMLVLMLLMVMVVRMIMLFMLVFVVMIMVMMVVGLVVLCLLRGQAGQLFLEGILVLHGLQDLLTVQFLPGSGDDGGVGIVLPQREPRRPGVFPPSSRRYG